MPTPRHRTAIRRTDYSRPIRIALDSAIITQKRSVLDFGAGHGDDVRRLRADGFDCMGWDPHFSPDTALQVCDIVNIGFVLNVIENPAEREATLQQAWELASVALLVAVRPRSEARGASLRPAGDGGLTSVGTFQKFFDQVELKTFVERVLGGPCLPVEPGIVVVFRSDADRRQFLRRQLRRPRREIRIREADQLYARFEESCDALLGFYSDRGRTPHSVAELPGVRSLVEEVGSIRKALHVVRRLVGRQELNAMQEFAKQELVLYLALDRFGGRPRFGELSEELRRDIRGHFPSYAGACREADRLLFAAGNPMLVDAECRDAQVGKLTPHALYVHRTALSALSPELRVYEGCARVLIGDIPETTIIKLARREPIVSYLHYPQFDRKAHPELALSHTVRLRSLTATFRDYRDSENPAILHRKDALVASDYPHREKFSRLTRQEEAKGLLSNTSRIGTRRGWRTALLEAGVEVRGHRLVRRH